MAKQKVAPPTYTLTMVKDGTDAPVSIVSGVGEADAGAAANQIVQALGIVGYRGSVILEVLKNGIKDWNAYVTFTDDLPNGSWSISRN